MTVSQAFPSLSATTLGQGCLSRQFWNLDGVNFVGILTTGMLMDTAKKSKPFRISNLEKFNTDG